MSKQTLLGVNIDHTATLRQIRGTSYPSIEEIIHATICGGADSLTMHLREDRRHIQDQDVYMARELDLLPLNLEMASTAEIVKIALQVKPKYCCIVPEKRQELTTEGGLDVCSAKPHIADVCQTLHNASIQVSLFIEPELATIDAAKDVGADSVELHTGRYAQATTPEKIDKELSKLKHAARYAGNCQLQVNAGHGLTRGTVRPVSILPQVQELNVGHSIICDALLMGMENAVRAMRKAMR